jgi:TolB protein
MKQITLKVGIVILSISLALLFAEYFISTISGVAMQGEQGSLYIFNAIYFIISLTIAIGILGPVSGILNKWEKINITWKLFILFSFLLAIVIFLLFGGLEAMTGRWAHYSGGGSYIGSNPVFSPDGTKIIFSSPNTGHGDIYEMDVDGSNRKRLTTAKDYEGEPFYSPNGSKICYVREQRGQGQIYTMDRDGKNQKQLTSGSAVFNACSFSPDNKQVVYYNFSEHKHTICIMNTDSTNQKCLIGDNIDKSNPVFSAQGDSIYYYTVKTDDSYKMTAVEIWKQNINTLETQFVSTLLGELYEIKFSPDYKKIVYIAWQGDSQQYQQIYIANIDGTSVKMLTNTKELKSTPSFSYDGSKIIFLSELEGRGGDIMIINSDGSGLKSVGKTN